MSHSIPYNHNENEHGKQKYYVNNIVASCSYANGCVVSISDFLNVCNSNEREKCFNKQHKNMKRNGHFFLKTIIEFDKV